MLNGRKAIVTGSTSGIGLAILRALAAQGCDVMMNGFGDPAEIERLRTAAEEQFQVKALFNGADLSRAEGCAELVADTERRLGGVDILVNNAGIQFVSPSKISRWSAGMP